MVADNIRRLMVQSGMTVRDVVAATGIHARTIQALMSGDQKPHAKTLHKLAEGLGVSTHEIILDLPQTDAAQFDWGTNPIVQEIVAEEPNLFAHWSAGELEELASRFGTGGELTRDGVRIAIEAMESRRSVLDKVVVLLESDQSDLLAEFVDMLYRRAIDVRVD